MLNILGRKDAIVELSSCFQAKVFPTNKHNRRLSLLFFTSRVKITAWEKKARFSHNLRTRRVQLSACRIDDGVVIVASFTVSSVSGQNVTENLKKF